MSNALMISARKPSRPIAKADAVLSVKRSSEQAQALLLYGRWLRVSRRGVSVMNGCACGFDQAIELGELDAMILDYLLQKFSEAPQSARFIKPFLSRKKPNGLQRLLEALTDVSHGMSSDQAVCILNAIEVSIASIEEHHV